APPAQRVHRMRDAAAGDELVRVEIHEGQVAAPARAGEPGGDRDDVVVARPEAVEVAQPEAEQAPPRDARPARRTGGADPGGEVLDPLLSRAVALAPADARAVRDQRERLVLQAVAPNDLLDHLQSVHAAGRRAAITAREPAMRRC